MHPILFSRFLSEILAQDSSGLLLTARLIQNFGLRDNDFDYLDLTAVLKIFKRFAEYIVPDLPPARLQAFEEQFEKEVGRYFYRLAILTYFLSRAVGHPSIPIAASEICRIGYSHHTIDNIMLEYGGEHGLAHLSSVQRALDAHLQSVIHLSEKYRTPSSSA